MDAPSGLVNQMQAISGNNLTSQQTLQQHAMHSPNSIQSSSPTLQNQQQDNSGQSMQNQQQQNVPTYKWMQVKRNVPKPQSKWAFYFLLRKIASWFQKKHKLILRSSLKAHEN